MDLNLQSPECATEIETIFFLDKRAGCAYSTMPIGGVRKLSYRFEAISQVDVKPHFSRQVQNCSDSTLSH